VHDKLSGGESRFNIVSFMLWLQVRKRELMSVFSQAAGNHAFFAMVGPRFSRLKEIEEEAQTLDPTSVVVVEGNREVGEVRVFSTGQAEAVQAVTQKLKQVSGKNQNKTKQTNPHLF
jgi:hypothetical protein